MGYQPKRSPEEARRREERMADAELFDADPEFARSVGIDLTPLQVACYAFGYEPPPPLYSAPTETGENDG
jgi:hypothetical protein